MCGVDVLDKVCGGIHVQVYVLSFPRSSSVSVYIRFAYVGHP